MTQKASGFDQYGHKIEAEKNAFSGLTGGPQYAISHNGQRIATATVVPDFETTFATGAAWILVVSAVILTIGVYLLPILAFRRMANELGPPWGFLSVAAVATLSWYGFFCFFGGLAAPASLYTYPVERVLVTLLGLGMWVLAFGIIQRKRYRKARMTLGVT